MSATARLATENATSAVTTTPTAARARRPGTSWPSRRRCHHTDTLPRRIGVSMKRYEASVTMTVMAIASMNWATLKPRPDGSRMIWKIGQWYRYNP